MTLPVPDAAAEAVAAAAVDGVAPDDGATLTTGEVVEAPGLVVGLVDPPEQATTSTAVIPTIARNLTRVSCAGCQRHRMAKLA